MKQEELEKEIIAGLLINEKNIPIVAQNLEVDDFAKYRELYVALFEIWKMEGEKNVHLELAHKGFKPSETLELMESFYSRPIINACNELKEITTAQKTKSILQWAVSNFPKEKITDFVADLQHRLIKSIQTFTKEKPDAEDVVEEFKDYQLVYEEKRKSGQELLGLDTGYEKLNEIIDGLRAGHLWVLGGYTNLGKTFGALNIAVNLIKNKKRVVFYSLEMSRVDILSRMLGIMLGENGTAIAKGFVDQKKVQPHLETLRDSGLAIYNEKTELSQILLSMYEETLKNKVDVFMLDFLGLVKVKGAKSEYEQMTEAILELQKTAQRYKVPIIVLSQVSNESAKGGEQLVMGFKGTGAIASASDLAIELVHGEESVKELRMKMDKGEPVKIKWIIKKNRHGRVGYIPMEFLGKTGIFTEENDNF